MNTLIAFWGKLWCFSFILHQNLTSGIFKMINCKIESQTLLNFVCSVNTKAINISCTLNISLSDRKCWFTELGMYLTLTLNNIRKTIWFVNITTDIIQKIIWELESSQAHGGGFKMAEMLIFAGLQIFNQNCHNSVLFPSTLT